MLNKLIQPGFTFQYKEKTWVVVGRSSVNLWDCMNLETNKHLDFASFEIEEAVHISNKL